MLKIYGIVGNPLGQSLSPVIQNAALKACGLPETYQKFELREDEFDGFMKGLRKHHIAGLTVTMPFKQKVIPYLDRLDATARKIGAVNMIEIMHGVLIGHNTDCTGAVRALEDRVNLKGKRILLLGFGGAARAIAYGLHGKRAIVSVYSPELFAASPVTHHYIDHTVPFEKIRGSDYDVIINATPVGMYPDISHAVLSARQLKGCPLVMDIVYKPLKTKFLREAEDAGAAIITGDRMLLYQGARQFEIWHKKKAPLQAMERALLKAIAKY